MCDIQGAPFACADMCVTPFKILLTMPLLLIQEYDQCDADASSKYLLLRTTSEPHDEHAVLRLAATRNHLRRLRSVLRCASSDWPRQKMGLGNTWRRRRRALQLLHAQKQEIYVGEVFRVRTSRVVASIRTTVACFLKQGARAPKVGGDINVLLHC